MTVQPYLFFDGRCEEAIDFYREALAAEVTMLLRHGDAPTPAGTHPPGAERKIMHASFRVGGSEILASDGDVSGCLGSNPPTAPAGFSLALSVADRQQAEQRLAALAVGGEIVQPLIETFFSPAFGVVRDRYSVTWMLVAPQA